MHLLKFDLEAKTLTEIPPGEFAAEPACRYFYMQGKHASVPVLTPDGIGEIVWQHPDYQPPSPANAMSETHRATPEQWAQQKSCSERYDIDSSCIMELLHRVQALEAAQQLRTFTAEEVAPIVVPAAKPPTAAQQLPLVERMARALGKVNEPIPTDGSSAWTPEARAALRVVAAWLRSELLSRNVADLLDNEANR